MANISIYGSHNSAFAIEENGKILTVIEVERFCGYKNCAIAQYKAVYNSELALKEILRWIKSEYGIERFENCYHSNTDIVHDETI